MSFGPGTQSLRLEHLSVDNTSVTYLEETWSETERLDDGDNGEDAHVMPQIRIHLKQSRVASLHHPPPPPAFFHALTSIHSRTHFLIVSHFFSDLDFADDVALLAELLELLVPALETMASEAASLGLELNWQKQKSKLWAAGRTYHQHSQF